MKKKILITIHALGGGGAEKALINWLNEVDYSKYDIDLQLFENKGINLEYLPKEVHLLPALMESYPEIGSQAHMLIGALKAGRLCVAGNVLCGVVKAAVVNKKRTRKRALIAWNAARKYIVSSGKKYDVAIGYMQGLPTYYTIDKVTANRKYVWVHNDYSQIEKLPEEKAYFEKADKVFTISDVCVNALEKAFPTVKNFAMMHNISSEKLIERLADEPCEEIDASVPLKLLTSGRFTFQKGYDYAIDAAKILKDRGIAFQWYLLGTGELKDDMLRQIRENDVVDNFVFLGLQPNPYKYMKNVDIIVQTSRYEGKSVVLDEAKILKKPIVVTNYPSVSDQITSGKDGLVVPVTPAGIADGIVEMMERDTKQQYIERLHMFAEENGIENKATIESHTRLLEGTFCRRDVMSYEQIS